MLGRFVCPTVSMVTTGKATGLEKTLFRCLNFKKPKTLVLVYVQEGGRGGGGSNR